mmetsp:Transcript_42402/g.107756  ORF Transcript_42402/g.107756 Transcript_42402/m.107756 type:complete len:200 (+) Transcript_42402:207-806(+)
MRRATPSSRRPSCCGPLAAPSGMSPCTTTTSSASSRASIGPWGPGRSASSRSPRAASTTSSCRTRWRSPSRVWTTCRRYSRWHLSKANRGIVATSMASPKTSLSRPCPALCPKSWSLPGTKQWERAWSRCATRTTSSSWPAPSSPLRCCSCSRPRCCESGPKTRWPRRARMRTRWTRQSRLAFRFRTLTSALLAWRTSA